MPDTLLFCCTKEPHLIKLEKEGITDFHGGLSFIHKCLICLMAGFYNVVRWRVGLCTWIQNPSWDVNWLEDSEILV